ncbi:SocA family protein [Microbacterium sp. C5A9]|nr:SocA family protein [Microbacterium sp. C5A9]
MKLQKLLFLSHSRYMHDHGRPLVRERVEAWKHGPVIDVVYQEYKSYGSSCIHQSLAENGPWVRLPDDVVGALENVWESFGVLSGWALRELTHEIGPWQSFYDSRSLHTEIPITAIGSAWPLFKTHAADRGPEAAALRRLEELRRRAAARSLPDMKTNTEALRQAYESWSESRTEATTLLS